MEYGIYASPRTEVRGVLLLVDRSQGLLKGTRHAKKYIFFK